MRPILFILILGIAASGWAAHFFLGDLAEDEEMIIRREFSENLQQLEPDASGGNAASQTELGLLYLTSHEFVRDPEIASKWFESAAKQGYPMAQYLYGRLYEDGTGVQQNYETAAQWYRRAANVGLYPDAEYALGSLYNRGLGVGHSNARAMEWYRKAAEGEQPVAQFLIGRMYETGYGVRADKIEAYVWYSLATGKRETVVTENPDYDPVSALDRLSETMNQSQIDAAKKLLNQWKPTH